MTTNSCTTYQEDGSKSLISVLDTEKVNKASRVVGPGWSRVITDPHISGED